MKLAIGTANLDKRYGFRKSKIKKAEIIKLFRFIKKNKINLIDTADIYGNSEKIIGNQKLDKEKIITKIYVNSKNYKKKIFIENFQKSLKRLKRKKIYGLLIHNIFDLKFEKRKSLFKILKFLKRNKKIQKIGFSIYSPKDLSYFKNLLTPDILQIPINIFDRRFDSKFFKKYIFGNRIEIHSRSCFLQGLIINYKKNDIRFQKFKKWDFLFNNLDKFCEKFSITRMEACILYLKKNKMIKYAIFGFENIKQLKMITSLFNNNSKILKFPNNLSIKDEKLIDPRKW